MLKKLNDNSEQILKQRYYVDDKEDWPGLCRRVTDTVIPVSCSRYSYPDKEVSELRDAVFTMINELYFLPNSPTLFNAGTDYPMLSACFIIDVEDDLASIYESVKESALIHKMGGGVGFAISKLRTRGSSIGSTHGKSSGSVSFLRVFSSASMEITAGGRREGANMCIQRVDHGDILEFISSKEKEGTLSNFNITVAVTDAFMDAYVADEEVSLIDPKDNSAVATVRARDLLRKIAHNAWLNGEPGISFIDAVNRDNPVPHMGEIYGSNPCQPGWAPVLTPEGIKTFDDIDVGSTIWSGKRWTKVIRKVHTGVKDVYRYSTAAGVFYGTKEHKVVSGGEKVPVRCASSIDVSVGPQQLASIDMQAVMDGLVLGGGLYHADSSKVVLLVGASDSSYFDDISTLIHKHRPDIEDIAWEVDTSFSFLPNIDERVIPDDYVYGDRSKVISFLRGLYSAKGSVIDKAIALSMPNIHLIRAVQLMLSSLGISSYVTDKSSEDVSANNTSGCVGSFSLNISDTHSKLVFLHTVGFIQPYKNDGLREVCASCTMDTERRDTYDVTEVEYLSTEEVYDITVDDPEHTYWTGGVLVSNCGEFYNIPYNSCNLGSLNLTKFVNNGTIDWDLLNKYIHLAVTYLDSIIDVNRYPLDKIDEVTKATRPVGLGVFGFADMLIMLGIKYDSQEGMDLARQLAEFISYHSLDASVDLAKRRGSYPEFKASNHQYKRQREYGVLNWKKLVGRIRKHGLRNSHTMVIAPTGTLARIANECSFGIEPVFAFSYESNILKGKQVTRHALYQDFIDGKLDVPEEVFVTAGEIDWKHHIDMQSAWQLFTHNGISKTINMPEGTTEDDVLSAYLYAYESGLKGLTIYIAGSRKDEVLVSSDRAEKKQSPGRKPKEIDMDVLKKLVEQGMTANALSDIFDCSISTIRRRVKELNLSAELLPDKIDRPDELWGPKYRIPSPNGNVYIEIGVDEETKKPIETIVTISKSGNSVNAMAEALGKMVSKALQHRMDPYEVVDTLKDIIGGDSVGWWRGVAIKSIPDAIATALETYLSSNYSPHKTESPAKKTDTLVKTTGGTPCPECGEFMVESEGCRSCPNCSYAKCG